MPPELSIVIPAYNEATRILPSLEKVRAFLVAEGCSAEVLVVNDGSQDGTATLVRAYEATLAQVAPLRVLDNPINRGKGYAVRQGILESCGRLVLYTDTDLS